MLAPTKQNQIFWIGCNHLLISESEEIKFYSMIVYLDSSISSFFYGYSSLIKLYHEIRQQDYPEVEISFLKTKWFEANLAAVLGAIIGLLEYEGKRISISNIYSPKDILQRNGFLERFGYEPIYNRLETIVPYRQFNPKADNDFILYVKRELLAKPDFPRHSELLGKRISENIYELFENARTHGKCKFIHTCGQYFPNYKILCFTIVDMGRTIKTNVNEFLNTNMSGSESIEKKKKNGNTTKTGDNPGGLGLSIIMEFLKKNRGKIQIISSDGFWEYKEGRTRKKEFDNYFPGTIANIVFNLSDNTSYVLRESY